MVYPAESYRRSLAVAVRQTSYREVMEGVQGVLVQQLATVLREPLSLFQNRLVNEEERVWTNTNIDEEKSVTRPILFSNWLSKNYYIPVEQGELRDYTEARIKEFYEEELDVPLVLFNEVLDHLLRIDRIFRQGH